MVVAFRGPRRCRCHFWLRQVKKNDNFRWFVSTSEYHFRDLTTNTGFMATRHGLLRRRRPLQLKTLASPAIAVNDKISSEMKIPKIQSIILCPFTCISRITTVVVSHRRFHFAQQTTATSSSTTASSSSSSPSSSSSQEQSLFYSFVKRFIQYTHLPESLCVCGGAEAASQ